ncbi:MAG: hypothetical protein ABFS08_08910 [Pseudomonadota bacterium]
MRALIIVLAMGFLASCCHVVEPDNGAMAAEPAPAPEVSADVVADELIAAAMGDSAEGRIVCTKGDDVRDVRIVTLKDERCVLVYDNQLSGSGTKNALANRAACELQQKRMIENFIRSGFSCE